MQVLVLLLFLVALALPLIYMAKRRANKSSFATDIERLGREQNFHPARAFVNGLGALAIGLNTQQVYVGTVEGGARGKLYPLAGVLRYQSGVEYVGKSPKHFLDITVDGIDTPTRRLWFGTDQRTITEIGAALDVAWRNQKAA